MERQPLYNGGNHGQTYPDGTVWVPNYTNSTTSGHSVASHDSFMSQIPMSYHSGASNQHMSHQQMSSQSPVWSPEMYSHFSPALGSQQFAPHPMSDGGYSDMSQGSSFPQHHPQHHPQHLMQGQTFNQQPQNYQGRPQLAISAQYTATPINYQQQPENEYHHPEMPQQPQFPGHQPNGMPYQPYHPAQSTFPAVGQHYQGQGPVAASHYAPHGYSGPHLPPQFGQSNDLTSVRFPGRNMDGMHSARGLHGARTGPYGMMACQPNNYRVGIDGNSNDARVQRSVSSTPMPISPSKSGTTLVRSRSHKQSSSIPAHKFQRSQPANPVPGVIGFGRGIGAPLGTPKDPNRNAAFNNPIKFGQYDPIKHDPFTAREATAEAAPSLLTTPHTALRSPDKRGATPLTARQNASGYASGSPTLRSAKGKSIAEASTSVRSNPRMGPPPVFWPSDKKPGAPSVFRSGNRNEIVLDDDDSMMTVSTAMTVDPFMTLGPPEAAAINPKYKAPLVLSGFGRANNASLTAPVQEIRSAHLCRLCPAGGRPDVKAAFGHDNMPFIEPARLYHRDATSGVIMIKNIPYSVTRQEITAFLGRNANLIPEADEPIHIIMERVTSKTMDCFVEFVSLEDAVSAVNRFDTNKAGGRSGRLGDRHVDLFVVSHQELMAELFPKAKNVSWKGASPVIKPVDPDDMYNSGFKGFVTSEEMVMLVKHVVAPQRSPFSRECPQRPFECLIDTIIKYPWGMIDYITIEDRDLIFNATTELITLLRDAITDPKVDKDGQIITDVHLNHRLMKRMLHAIWLCPGFSVAQKDNIAFIAGIDPQGAGLPPFADHWSVFRVISMKSNFPLDVVMYYLALLREASAPPTEMSLAERSSAGASTAKSIFGAFTVDHPVDIKHLTIAEVGKLEWNAIEVNLRRVLV